ncbi:MAG TPA: type II toxin-antitoxin system RelE/ParE family toxin [Pyrinomonadaceae bacterium]|nr:type II toxin-antitoxin system RelE/ParE family toxin [Pyrinomonadaceae bacterium]
MTRDSKWQRINTILNLPSNVARYTLPIVIRSFRSADTQTLFETGKCKNFSGIANIAVRKLAQLDAAQTLEFLRSPPGNRLESLKGKRKGQYSIRVNDQFRICFRWTNEGPEDVEIVDYH